MTDLHKELKELAKQKTEMIKKGDTPELQFLLKKENKAIQDIRKTEETLVQNTTLFLEQKEMEIDSPILSKVIEVVEDTQEKSTILEQKEKLENEIKELKELNQLNQDLLTQSLQFVQLSLELLQPDIDSYNYDRSEKEHGNSKQTNHSMFDSKA